jgi:hypothetical protein
MVVLEGGLLFWTFLVWCTGVRRLSVTRGMEGCCGCLGGGG